MCFQGLFVMCESRSWNWRSSLARLSVSCRSWALKFEGAFRCKMETLELICLICWLSWWRLSASWPCWFSIPLNLRSISSFSKDIDEKNRFKLSLPASISSLICFFKSSNSAIVIKVVKFRRSRLAGKGMIVVVFWLVVASVVIGLISRGCAPG